MLSEEDKCLRQGGIRSGRDVRQEAGADSVAGADASSSVGLCDDR
jgi:hypothetical protein